MITCMLVRRLAAVPATPYSMAGVNVFLLQVRARDPTQSSDLSCPRTVPPSSEFAGVTPAAAPLLGLRPTDQAQHSTQHTAHSIALILDMCMWSYSSSTSDNAAGLTHCLSSAASVSNKNLGKDINSRAG